MEQTISKYAKLFVEQNKPLSQLERFVNGIAKRLGESVREKFIYALLKEVRIARCSA